MRAAPLAEAPKTPANPLARVGAQYPGAPRWVKVFGAVASAVAISFVLLSLTNGMHNG